MDVRPVRGVLDVPGERVDDTSGARRRAGAGAARGMPIGSRRGRRGGRRLGRGNPGGEVGRRLGVRQDAFAQGHAERAFEPHEQLYPLQAADAQIGFQRVAGADGRRALAAQLADQLGDDREHPFLDAGAGRRSGCGRHTG